MRCVLRRGAVIFLMDDLGPPSAKTRSHQRQLQAKTETRPLISQSEIRATVVSGDTQATGHKMKRFLLLPAAVTLALTSAATVPAQAGGGDVAAGLIGGLAAGTIIGAAVTGPHYYGPPPVYVAPRGEPVWDGYRGVWVYPSVRVCE
jgi:hypothetical protein